MLKSFKSLVSAVAGGDSAEKKAPPIVPEKKAAPTPPPAEAAPKATGAMTELLTWSAPTINRKIVVAYLPGTDPTDPTKLVTVNVRANWNFMKGMRLRANKVSDTVYDLVGPLPRWKGRW